MTHREILAYIDAHYAEFPNFDGRTAEEIVQELPDQDERYADGEDGLVDLLNEIEYR